MALSVPGIARDCVGDLSDRNRDSRPAIRTLSCQPSSPGPVEGRLREGAIMGLFIFLEDRHRVLVRMIVNQLWHCTEKHQV